MAPYRSRDQHIADADADTNPDDQLDRSTQPLADCHIDADDGRNRREQRRAVPEEMHGDEPGEAGGQGRLDHRNGNASPTTQSPRKVLAKARPGRRRDRHAVGTGRTPPRFRSRATNFFPAGGNRDRACGFLTGDREES